MAVCKDNVDDEYDMDEHVIHTDNNIDEENSQAVDDIDISAGVVPQAVNDNDFNNNDNVRFNKFNPQAGENYNDIDRSDGVVPQTVNEVTPHYHELLLRLFTNNYELIAQKQSNLEGGLKIRALILKIKIVVHNYSFKIIGTDNVPNATISAAIVMCNLYFYIATKGDTLTCFQKTPKVCADPSWLPISKMV